MPRESTEENKRIMREYAKKHYHENKAAYIERSAIRKSATRKKLKAFSDRYKMLCGCVDCGYKVNPIALQFDHVRGQKEKDVSLMIIGCMSMKKIKEEIRKCEVRCANCHFIITDRRRRAESNCQ